MAKKYIPVTDVAKMIRRALKESFPDIKFSVRTSKYAGGSSIRVGYTDGPSAKLVESVVKTFQGSYFDGMTDYKGTNYHTLDGEPVMLGGDFVFVERQISSALRAKVIRRVAARYGATPAGDDAQVIADFNGNRLFPTLPWPERRFIEEEVWRSVSKVSDRLGPQPSPTAARLRFAGDDGYGFNSVGTAA